MPEFDVVVLGGGTSGTLIAMEVARAGRSAAIVEAGLVGGEAPYLADMPSKSLSQSARRGETWELAVARRDEVTRHLDDTAAAARLAEAGVTLFRGTGRISKPGTVLVAPIPAVPAGPAVGPAAGAVVARRGAGRRPARSACATATWSWPPAASRSRRPSRA